ncbi:MAG: hypothetical protein P9L92_20035 [Candidatus Electryonea clarkiae]|nr:hypothetical protein [Candidatus Electryonea clarkiae]MDP8288833.1 hypothetical protein [Candidatus Electryonea clarkiae]
MKFQKSAQSVIPAKAGIQALQQVTISWIPGSSPRMTLSDSQLRGNDNSIDLNWHKSTILPILIAIILIMSPAIVFSAEQEESGFAKYTWNTFSFSGLISEIPYGMNYSTIKPDKFGFCFEARLLPVRPVVNSNTVAIDEQTAEEDYGSVYRDSEHSWTIINFGTTRVLSARVSAYLVAGVSVKTVYKRYQDVEDVIMYVNSYWIRDRSTWAFNAGAGLQFLIYEDWGLSGQIGYNYKPAGATIGIGYAW